MSGIGPITRVDAEEYPAKVAAELKDFNVEDYMDKKEARKMDRFTQYAVVAAKMAVEDAELNITDEIAPRVGVWVGSGIGGLETLESQFEIFLTKGPRRVSPFFVPMMIPDMATGQISIALGAKGVNSCTVTACATGTNSIGDAFKVIQRGDADVMVTGGTEAPLTRMSFAGFSANKALSTNPDPKTASRPFDKNRDGFVMGEGAGIIVLEELEHAWPAALKFTEKLSATAQPETLIISQHRPKTVKAERERCKKPLKMQALHLRKLITSMLTGQARITTTNTKQWQLRPFLASMRINLR